MRQSLRINVGRETAQCRQYVHVAMGTLEDAPPIRPTKRIFVGSKAQWHSITDDLPQFDEFPTAAPQAEAGEIYEMVIP